MTTTTENGVVVSVQMLIAGQRAEMVFPMAWFNEDGPEKDAMSQAAVEAFEEELMGPLLNCLSEDAQVVGISAEHMDNGAVPYRRNFPLGSLVGNRAAGVVPQQVAALAIYYPSADDVSPGSPTTNGLNFIPGLAEEDVSAEILAPALKSVLEILANVLVVGFIAGGGTGILARCVFASRNGSRVLRKAATSVVRDYVGTIRRRLIPHN